MKAVYYEEFGGQVEVVQLPVPNIGDDDVLIHVRASGLCLSDWHGWMGHDEDISLPHVPGHEWSGEIAEVGKNVTDWKVGDRVTAPFCLGCGKCDQCGKGQEQICDSYEQPGFTYWGSFAEFVRIPYASNNLVRIPESFSFEDVAVLGCRFATAYRAVNAQGNLFPGDWIAVLGCGGVGLSAIMIANALGANVIAIDIVDQKLELARALGALHVLNSKDVSSIPSTVKEISSGGVHVAIDALGSRDTCVQGIQSLRKQGTHVQVGLMADEDAVTPITLGPLVGQELRIVGSHGLQPWKYEEMFSLIIDNDLPLNKLIAGTLSIEDVPQSLINMRTEKNPGIKILNQF